MLEEDLKIHTKVTISERCEFHGDYQCEILTIVGLHYDTKYKKLDITLRDSGGSEYDGWEASDLVKHYGDADDENTTD